MSKLKRKKDEFRITIPGEFFPESYPAIRSMRWSRGEEDPLQTEMRLFEACKRWAFNRLLEGRGRNELKRQGQELFGLNSRYVDDAIEKAREVVSSQKGLLEREIEQTRTKLYRARKKLDLATRKLLKAKEKGAAPEAIEKLRLAVKGRRSRVASLEKKLAGLLTHQENGTIPKVVFGGRRLWKRVSKGRATREEWQAARKCRLYSRGDETKGGNPHFKITREFRMSVTISHLSGQIGTDSRGRLKMSRAPRVEGRLWIPEKHRELVRLWALAGLPYAVELIRGRDGRYRVHISLELGEAPKPDFQRGCLGLDINPDGVDLCNLGSTGQPEPYPEDLAIPTPSNLGKYEGEFQVIPHPHGFLTIRIPDLKYASGSRRSYLIGVLAKVVVDIAKFLGKPIALEDLEFGKDRLDTNHSFNRMASNFPYAEITKAICRRAYKERVTFGPTPPQHTSTIGYWKYMRRYGVSVHCASALVVGRRAMGYREEVSEELRKLVIQIDHDLANKVKLSPKEGTGMTRRARAALKRIAQKMEVHNGLPPWKQVGFRSIWCDFKVLALELRRPRLAGVEQTGRRSNRAAAPAERRVPVENLSSAPGGGMIPPAPQMTLRPCGHRGVSRTARAGEPGVWGRGTAPSGHRVGLPGRGPLSPCPRGANQISGKEAKSWSGGRPGWR